MLNAFRHQRRNHKDNKLMANTIIKCSTPFGINEGITEGVSGLGARRGRVLNAFRHQRRDHRFIKITPSVFYHVLNAFRHQRRDHETRFGKELPPDCVLNAFRHQRRDHAAQNWGKGNEKCAQRLSASTKGSRKTSTSNSHQR